jgi:hypothetical protein
MLIDRTMSLNIWMGGMAIGGTLSIGGAWLAADSGRAATDRTIAAAEEPSPGSRRSTACRRSEVPWAARDQLTGRLEDLAARNEARHTADRLSGSAEGATHAPPAAAPVPPGRGLSVLRQGGAEGIDEYLDVKLVGLVAR